MTTVFDVADYILEKAGPMTGMKLQKIVYYSQAWSLVWENTPLFEDKIEAWMNGPVIPTLFERHKGKLHLNSNELSGTSELLSNSQKETIEEVIRFYADKSAQWLNDLTHREKPWRDARHGLSSNHRGNNEISLASMHEYYSSIQ